MSIDMYSLPGRLLAERRYSKGKDLVCQLPRCDEIFFVECRCVQREQSFREIRVIFQIAIQARLSIFVTALKAQYRRTDDGGTTTVYRRPPCVIFSSKNSAFRSATLR